MLEFFMLRALCTALGNQARAKGYTATGYQVMLVALWFGGEISGFILGMILAYLLDPKADEPNWVIAVIIAYLTAGAGAGFTFLLIKWLPDTREQGMPALRDGWDEREVRERFAPRAAEPDRKDVTTEPNDPGRHPDERYATE